jgi:hypothetical protein
MKLMKARSAQISESADVYWQMARSQVPSHLIDVQVRYCRSDGSFRPSWGLPEVRGVLVGWSLRLRVGFICSLCWGMVHSRETGESHEHEAPGGSCWRSRSTGLGVIRSSVQLGHSSDSLTGNWCGSNLYFIHRPPSTLTLCGI